MFLGLPSEVQTIATSTLCFAVILITSTALCGNVLKGSYALSTIHAVSMLIFTSYVIFIDCGVPGYLHCEFDSISNNDLQQSMLQWSVGYFIVDSVVVLFLSPDWEAAFHHLTIIIGQISAIQTGRCGYALAWFLFLAELSAPFLNCFLSGLTIEGTKTDFIMRSLFAGIFITSRLIICPFMTYKFVFDCKNAPLTPRLVCLAVMGLSVVWGKRVIAAVIAALSPSRKADETKNI
jgi:hypothetical protein